MLSVVKANIKIVWGVILLFGLCVENAVSYDQGVINSHRLNIRRNADLDAGVVAVLEKGDRVRVIDNEGGIGGWLQIEFNGTRGYVRNRPQYIRVKKNLNARAQADAVLEKKQIQEKIESQEKMAAAFSEKETQMIEGLNEIDYALNKARIRVTALSSEIVKLADRIGGLSGERQALAKEISDNREYTGKRLRALYKMKMIGRLETTGMPQSIFDFFVQQNAMKRVIQSDVALLAQQTSDYEKFDGLKVSLQKEIQSKKKLEAQLNEQIRVNKSETLKREMILQEIRKKKKLTLAAVESLKNAELALDQRIAGLPAGEDTKIRRLSFVNYKGRLIFPVKGEIISMFGPSEDKNEGLFDFQKGIDIQVERGEPVRSVFKGKVMFAEWLKGYGNVMIINHGDNYYTLYAHVEEIFKQQGEHVETGEVIATAGDTGSIKGMCLHFELRYHGKPVDPLNWLKKGA